MYEDDLILVLRELKIDFKYNNLFQIDNYEDKVTSPYLSSFNISIKEYYEDFFLEMVFLNLYIYVKNIDYENKTILFENNDSYKFKIYTKNPNIYDIKLINVKENLSYYEESIYSIDILIIREFHKMVTFLNFLGSYEYKNKN